MIELEKIDKALLYECKVGTNVKDSLWLQVRAGNHIFLANKANKDWSGKDLPICGFGKGSFKMIKGDADLPDGGVELSLEGSSDQICFDGRVVQLGEVVKDLRKKNPETKVTYFQMSFDSEDPHKFQLKRTHRVVFIPRPEEKAAEVKDSNAGARENVQLWHSSDSVAIMWHMKHSPVKGLIPLKPAVFLKSPVQIPPQQALVVVRP